MILNNMIISETIVENNNIEFINFPASPILIQKFKKFQDVAPATLELIEKTNLAKNEIIEKEKTNITKSDFHLAMDENRQWLKNIENVLISNLIEMCMSMGYMGFTMNNIWFQQYQNLSSHEWHLHQFSNYSGVFYLEFPEDGPKTEFYDFFSKTSTFLDMSEGDIAIFPAHLPHRSPVNNSKKRKTIISFNISFLFPTENHKYINDSLEKNHG